MAQDNEVYENIETEDYTSLGTPTNKGTTANVQSMGGAGARVVHTTNTKSPKWVTVVLVHVVTLIWCAALTGVIIWNNIKLAASQTEKAMVDACEKFPCTNNGICIAKSQTPQCVCPTGFTGDLCQINLGQLCTYHTCLNGGICTVKDDTDKALCVCSQGYSGDYCETGHNQSTVVAFNTKLSAAFAHMTGVNRIIPFNNITLNIGNGFDGGSHKFTAPVSGIYMFTYCAFSYGVNGVIRVCLMLNGRLSTTVLAISNGYDSGCNIELFSLSVGDVVHVELSGYDSTKGLYDDTWNYNTFSGHLVHQV